MKDNVSWVIGFGMLTAVIAAGLLLFLLGIKRYRKEGPLGSAFTTVAQVFVAAARKWRVNETLHSTTTKVGNRHQQMVSIALVTTSILVTNVICLFSKPLICHQCHLSFSQNPNF
jgi:hypothetical protein